MTASNPLGFRVGYRSVTDRLDARNSRKPPGERLGARCARNCTNCMQNYSVCSVLAQFMEKGINQLADLRDALRP